MNSTAGHLEPRICRHAPPATPGTGHLAGDGWKWAFLCRSQGKGPQSLTDLPGSRSPKLAKVEAAFFVSEGPLSERKLMQCAMLADVTEAREMIRQLNAVYDAHGSPFRVEKLATGYQLLTRPIFAPWLDRVHNRKARPKLSPPMMETLVVIAYRQPITRADVESIRGVQCSDVIKQLLDRGFVRVTGEDDSLGRPFLYGTTRFFLENFGLRSLDDLPMTDRLKKPTAKPVVEESLVPDDFSSAA